MIKRSLLALICCNALLFVSLLAVSGCGGGSDGYSLPAPTATPTQPANGGLPGDIPIYPGAQFVGNPSPGQATFQAPASQEMVKSFYQQQMPQNGWQEVQVVDNGADGIFLSFSKDTRMAHISISPGTSSSQSVILITIGNS